MPKSERLLRVAEALRRAPHSVSELRERLWPGLPPGPPRQAAERSLQRDLEQLRRLQPGFTRLPGRPPRYHLGEQCAELPLSELLAAHAVLRAVSPRTSGPAHRAALARLSAWAPAALRPALTQGLCPPGRRSRELRNLDLAAQAWVAGRPLGFTWREDGEAAEERRELHIHTIEAHPHTLELRAVGLETRHHRAVVAFRLAAMRGARVLAAETCAVSSEPAAPALSLEQPYLSGRHPDPARVFPGAGRSPQRGVVRD